jgi:hypothetical protein
LQGVIVLYPLAIPMMGLPKSWSPNPTALNIALLGERWIPLVTASERSMDCLALRRITSVNLPAALSLPGAEIFELTAHIRNRRIQLFDTSFEVAVALRFRSIACAESLTAVLHARRIQHGSLIAKPTPSVSLREQPPSEACRTKHGATHQGGQSS